MLHLLKITQMKKDQNSHNYLITLHKIRKKITIAIEIMKLMKKILKIMKILSTLNQAIKIINSRIIKKKIKYNRIHPHHLNLIIQLTIRNKKILLYKFLIIKIIRNRRIVSKILIINRKCRKVKHHKLLLKMLISKIQLRLINYNSWVR